MAGKKLRLGGLSLDMVYPELNLRELWKNPKPIDVDLSLVARQTREMGFGAASCNWDMIPYSEVFPERADELKAVFAAEDVIIAEVGAYSLNTLDPDEKIRNENIAEIKRTLRCADAVGANCCVMHAGRLGGSSREKRWSVNNLSDEVFNATVRVIQEILDDVNPQNTKLTFETEYAILPDSPEVYAKLIEAIDRPGFACHFDPVNIIKSLRRYYFQEDFLKRCFALLGSFMVCCHVKDIAFYPAKSVWLEDPSEKQVKHPRPVTWMEEITPPGRGTFDVRTLLKEVSSMENPPPLIIEHLGGDGATRRKKLVEGRDYLFKIAEEEGISFVHGENRGV